MTQSNHVKRKLKQRNQSRKLDEVRARAPKGVALGIRALG